MGKRIRKPPIKPEERRDWLRRSEENGESPPQIAKKDVVDVRTVRKQIELAKQERENREARSTVLRNAMESHYNDLRNYAERLNTQVSGKVNTPPSPDEEFIEAALHEHLPRSPIWDYLRKKQNLEKTEAEQLKNIKLLIEQLVKSDCQFHLSFIEINKLFPDINKALESQAKDWSLGREGINPKDHLHIEPEGIGFVNICYGAIRLRRIDAAHADEYLEILREVLPKLESSLKQSEQYQELEKTVAELDRLNRKLREELAVIRLRRIVPGRCRFCPL
jgi:chemotaxis protein histidine kinase CheA